MMTNEMKSQVRSGIAMAIYHIEVCESDINTYADDYEKDADIIDAGVDLAYLRDRLKELQKMIQ